jgi:hypothetical protein
MQAVGRCLVFHISFSANVGAAGDGTCWDEEDRMNETNGALMNNTSLQSPMVKLSKACNSKSYTPERQKHKQHIGQQKEKVTQVIFMYFSCCLCV